MTVKSTVRFSRFPTPTCWSALSLLRPALLPPAGEGGPEGRMGALFVQGLIPQPAPLPQAEDGAPPSRLHHGNARRHRLAHPPQVRTIHVLDQIGRAHV